jgi:hypothetical protein
MRAGVCGVTKRNVLRFEVDRLDMSGESDKSSDEYLSTFEGTTEEGTEELNCET